MQKNYLIPPDKERQKLGNRLFKFPAGKFEPIDLSKAGFIPDGMTKAYRNNRYTVMVYENTPTTAGPATQVLIQKHNDTPILNHWGEIQNIKNEIFGENTVAVEYYPKEQQLVNDKNIYWIWIFPEGKLPIPLK